MVVVCICWLPFRIRRWTIGPYWGRVGELENVGVCVALELPSSSPGSHCFPSSWGEASSFHAAYYGWGQGGMGGRYCFINRLTVNFSVFRSVSVSLSFSLAVNSCLLGFSVNSPTSFGVF